MRAGGCRRELFTLSGVKWLNSKPKPIPCELKELIEVERKLERWDVTGD